MIQMIGARPHLGREPGARFNTSHLDRSISATDTVLMLHGDIESEVHAAWLDGFDTGLTEANRRMAAALDQALGGSNGYGLETTSIGAKEAIRRMLRGMVGVE